MELRDCIYPDCQQVTDFGSACEHSCPFESLVRQVKEADGEPPEAGFDNVDDLLKYLNEK